MTSTSREKKPCAQPPSETLPSGTTLAFRARGRRWAQGRAACGRSDPSRDWRWASNHMRPGPVKGLNCYRNPKPKPTFVILTAQDPQLHQTAPALGGRGAVLVPTCQTSSCVDRCKNVGRCVQVRQSHHAKLLPLPRSYPLDTMQAINMAWVSGSLPPVSYLRVFAQLATWR